MNISFETNDKVNGLMTITIEKEDYASDVDKQLKDLRKRANIPGFRQGQAPVGMIKRMYGTQAKMDAVNKLIGDKLYEYVRENNIAMLGEPLPNANQVPVELDKTDGPYTFMFDIAVAPEFKAELSDKDTIEYCDITVDDKMIDEQVEMFRMQLGHQDTTIQEYNPETRDLLKGDLRELDAEGNTKEDGIVVEGAVLMPQYIKVEEQKALFDGTKVGSIITFNPRKAYPDNDSEVASLLKIDKSKVAEMTSDFTYQVTEISRHVKADVNQELFDQVMGKDVAKDEADFRAKIAEGIKLQLTPNCDFLFMKNVRKHLEEKVGELTFPTELLKRIMRNNNKDKDEKFIEDNFDMSVKELQWSLMKNQLVEANEIKIDDNDVKSVAKGMARAQFAQYGMTNVPDEYLEKYANDMLKERKSVDMLVDRAVDQKLMQALKGVVTLSNKSITLDEFNKLMEA
ncbi:MAG: trigger factor [Prevotella sp.]|nr:trigger factor [Prevotella sp.]